MANSNTPLHHEIHVAEDLALPSKRAAVYKIVQSVKDDLTSVEERLGEIAAGTTTSTGSDGKVVEDLAKTLQQLQATLGDTAEYLPAFEQRLLQTRIFNANRVLSDRRSQANASQGFSFRRAPKTGKLSKTSLVGSDLPDAVLATSKTVSSNSGLSIDQGDTIGMQNCSGVEKKFERSVLRGKDVVLSSLVDCKIFLEGTASTLNLKNLKGCLVIAGPIRTSVFMTGCRDCTVAVACQQLRIHDSENLRCYVHLTSGGIVEDTKNCAFAPYTVSYPGLDCDFVEANLRAETNDNWQHIEDFNYVVSNKRSPNWTVIPEEERKAFGDTSF
ncbi:putative Tubulin-specific chaperone C [Hypsibius exemplaris]|uniref:Tubulin-specific chaperone C n=1 Tax=Hypsibius exemplaris TaxID=2072580 RepID=A0A1W0WD75_HYPEX|nr:putative Tubulin-specific chaperone C [Hypsibius exemplaris]